MPSTCCFTQGSAFKLLVKLISKSWPCKIRLRRAGRRHASTAAAGYKANHLGVSSLAALFVILVFERKGGLGKKTAQFLLVFDF